MEAETPRQYRASFLHRGEWWVAWSDDVPGALTQGRTLEEARENLRDAIALLQEDDSPAAAPDGELVREWITV